jgi:agmatinase
VQAEFYDDRVGGHKFAIQIVTDVPHFGGASGSSLEEAQSWGKLSIESEKVTVHGDVTLALPLLVTALETRVEDTSHKRKRPEFDPVRSRCCRERPAARRQPLSGVVMSSRSTTSSSSRSSSAASCPETFAESAAVILPVPFDRTTSYVPGTRNGPRELLLASAQVELWDEESAPTCTRTACSRCPRWTIGQHHGDAMAEIGRVTAASSTPEIPDHAWRRTLDHVADRRAPRRPAPGLSVLQIDAHADCATISRRTPQPRLRDATHHGTRAARAGGDPQHLGGGVKALPSLKTRIFLRLEHAATIRAGSIVRSTRCQTTCTSRLIWMGSNPGLMPAVGTPEPGGLSWRELTTLLRRTFERRRVYACDVVELCPIQGMVSPNFVAARWCTSCWPTSSAL